MRLGRFFAGMVTALFGAGMAAAAPVAPPIVLPPPVVSPITMCEAVWIDMARERSVPVRIRMPTGREKVGVILFSHGLGGSLDAGTIWAHAWAEAGFAVVNVQHVGTDSAIFGKPGFRTLLNSEQLIIRARDVQFVIRELIRRPVEGACDLSRIDQRRIGVAGHSFGAQTIQAVAGQILSVPVQPPVHDPRVRAAIGFSPSPPLTGSAEVAFSRVHIPFLSVTGTADAVPFVTPITPLQRQEPFRLMPPGDKFLLVLKGGTHEMFAGQTFTTLLNGEPTPHIRDTVIATTTAFWRAMLNDDLPAMEWLYSRGGVRSGLQPGDFFETR